jgi:hypothetical protein
MLRKLDLFPSSGQKVSGHKQLISIITFPSEYSTMDSNCTNSVVPNAIYHNYSPLELTYKLHSINTYRFSGVEVPRTLIIYALVEESSIVRAKYTMKNYRGSKGKPQCSKISGQLHAPAILSLGKQASVESAALKRPLDTAVVKGKHLNATTRNRTTTYQLVCH